MMWVNQRLLAMTLLVVSSLLLVPILSHSLSPEFLLLTVPSISYPNQLPDIKVIDVDVQRARIKALTGLTTKEDIKKFQKYVLRPFLIELGTRVAKHHFTHVDPQPQGYIQTLSFFATFILRDFRKGDEISSDVYDTVLRLCDTRFGAVSLGGNAEALQHSIFDLALNMFLNAPKIYCALIQESDQIFQIASGSIMTATLNKVNNKQQAEAIWSAFPEYQESKRKQSLPSNVYKKSKQSRNSHFIEKVVIAMMILIYEKNPEALNADRIVDIWRNQWPNSITGEEILACVSTLQWVQPTQYKNLENGVHSFVEHHYHGAPKSLNQLEHQINERARHLKKQKKLCWILGLSVLGFSGFTSSVCALWIHFGRDVNRPLKSPDNVLTPAQLRLVLPLV